MVSAQHVGPDGLQGEEFTGGDLLEGGGMDDIVRSCHGGAEGIRIPHIPQIKPELAPGGGEAGPAEVAHVILLFLVPGENANFPNIGFQKAGDDPIAKGTGPAGDQKDFSRKVRNHNGASVGWFDFVIHNCLS